MVPERVILHVDLTLTAAVQEARPASPARLGSAENVQLKIPRVKITEKHSACVTEMNTSI